MSTRQHILTVARQRYLAGGLAGVSMRGVAKEVGVSATAIYRHFDGKEDLLWEVVEQSYVLFMQCLDAAAPADDRRGDLDALLVAYLDFALDHPRDYTLLFVDTHHINAGLELPPRIRRLGAQSLGRLTVRVESAIDAGVLRSGQPMDRTLQIWAHLHGLCSLQLGGRLGMSTLAFRDLVLRSMRTQLDGLSL